MYFGNDFRETYVLFSGYIEKDKDFLKEIPAEQIIKAKKNGMLSAGMRFLINQYVELKKKERISKEKEIIIEADE
jgi:hypothetical protein